jgi:ATP synthase protein I
MGRRWAEVVRFIGIGWYIAVCILLGVLGGRWLGQRLDSGSSEAIFIILGLCLGLVVAFYGVYRMLRSIMSEKQNNGKGNS